MDSENLEVMRAKVSFPISQRELIVFSKVVKHFLRTKNQAIRTIKSNSDLQQLVLDDFEDFDLGNPYKNFDTFPKYNEILYFLFLWRSSDLSVHLCLL